MLLMHCAFWKNINKIITDGYIKAGNDTGKSFAGEPNSKNIYLSLVSDKLRTTPFAMPSVYPFYLSTELLKEGPFWISVRWLAKENSIYIDPKKQNIYDILKFFEKKILKDQKKYKLLLGDDIALSMSNQIIIRHNISLDKYLIALPDPIRYYKNIFSNEKSTNIKKKIKKKYKDVVILKNILL